MNAFIPLDEATFDGRCPFNHVSRSRGEQACQAESGLVHVTTLAETAMINSHLFESLREKSTIPRHPDGRSGAVD